MKYLTLLFLPVLLLLSACDLVSLEGNPIFPSATPDIYTLSLGNIQAQKTLEAMQATSQALSANLTATAYYPTVSARQTATERAWLMTGWTATASVKQTETSASGTATQQHILEVSTQQASDITATVEVAAASARATEFHAQAVSAELAMERERMMNKVQALSPFFIGFSILAFVLLMIFRWSRIRPIQRDARGDAPLLFVNGNIYDADRNPYSLADFSGKKPVIPALTNAEIQSATTNRDQMIDLATRGNLDQPMTQRQSIAQQLVSEHVLNAPGTIQVISAQQARPLLGNAIDGIMRDAIDADITSENKGEQNA